MRRPRRDPWIRAAIAALLLAGATAGLPAGGSAQQGRNLGDALHEKDLAAVRRLIAGGVDLNAEIPGYGSPPLSEAVNQDWAEVIPVLVEAGADPNRPDERRGWTPLMEAVSLGRTGPARALLAAGADPARAGRKGRTALDIAYDRKNDELVRMLVEAGAPLDRAGPDGVPLLLRAVSAGKRELVALLLENGASPGVKDMLGNTPLFAAASAGDAETVRLLVRAGADPNATNAMGFTPRQMAELQGFAEVVEALAAAGAEQAALALRDREETKEAVKENLERIVEERRRERAAREAALPPAVEVTGEGTYPEGRFTGPCLVEASDAEPGIGVEGRLHFTTTQFVSGHVTEEEILETPVLGDILKDMRDGSMTSGLDLVSALSPLGGSTAVTPPECEAVRLRAGEYTRIVHDVEDRWRWEGPEGGCRPGVYCSVHAVTLEGYPKIRRTYTPFTIREKQP